jgi:hypothetical protein
VLAGKLQEAYDYCKAENDALIGVASMAPSAAPDTTWTIQRRQNLTVDY